MKRYGIIGVLLITFIVARAQELSFGQITITPYISKDAGLDATASRLLMTKMAQVVTANEAAGGFDRRFIITPSINILSETETATIPQKTSLKADITFFVGDATSGTLFNAYSIQVSGVGQHHNDALYSAIRKVNAKDDGLATLITEGKKKIVDYYNTNAPTLISEAKGYMASHDYENALARLSVVPSACRYHKEAQDLISACGSKIIARESSRR